MEAQHLGGTTPGKKKVPNFWWPKTDTIEHARDAAKGGFLAFGYLAIGMLLYAITMYVQQLMTPDDRAASLIALGLVCYLTWRTFTRPTILLNSIAFVLVTYVLAVAVTTTVAALATMPVVAPRAVISVSLSALSALAAVGGIRGSFAVRRFEAVSANTQT